MPLHGLDDVKKMMNKSKDDANTKIKGVYFAGLSNIIAATPADQGLHRNAWFLSVRAASVKTRKLKNKGGVNSINQLYKMPESVLGKKIYFTNNAPAISLLEYGGYPSPVKKGSYIKKSKSYQILSINGFSKQAPGGWVRSTLISMSNKIRTL